MARNRMIKPEFWEDEKVAKLSFEARLLFLGLWNFADDKGYIKHNPIVLKAKIFPYENFKSDKIETILKELFNQNMLLEQNGIIKIKNFSKHQKIKNPSKSNLENEFKNQCDLNDTNQNVGSPTPDLPQTYGSPTPLKEVKEKLKENKEKEKEKEVKEKTKNDSFLNSPKNKTAETANGNNNGSVDVIPTTYKGLVDYLIRDYGIEQDKAKIIANRVQSDKFVLTVTHCREFADMQENDIIGFFDMMKAMKKKQNKTNLCSVANVFRKV